VSAVLYSTDIVLSPIEFVQIPEGSVARAKVDTRRIWSLSGRKSVQHCDVLNDDRDVPRWIEGGWFKITSRLSELDSNSAITRSEHGHLDKLTLFSDSRNPSRKVCNIGRKRSV